MTKPTWHLPVVAAVAQYFGLKAADVLGKCRAKRLALARHICWYVHDLDGYPLTKIGAAYRADHSSVSHGKARIAAMRISDLTFNREMTALLQQMNEGKPAPQVYEITIPPGSTVNIYREG